MQDFAADCNFGGIKSFMLSSLVNVSFFGLWFCFEWQASIVFCFHAVNYYRLHVGRSLSLVKHPKDVAS